METELRKKLSISDAVLAIFLPLIGYFIVFLFELGYFEKTNIPMEFLDVELSKALFASLVLGGSIVLFLISHFTYYLVFDLGPFLNAITLMFFPTSAILFGIQGLFLSLIMYIPIYYWALRIDWAENNKKNLPIKDVVFDLILSIDIIRRHLIKNFGETYANTMLAIFVVFISSFLLGAWQATVKQKYIVVYTSPEVVVLKKYSDHIICSTFNRNKKIIMGDFSLISFDQLSREGTIFRIERLGHLKSRNP